MKLFSKIKAKIDRCKQRTLRKRLRNIAGITAGEQGTSITASMLYPAFCALATKDDKIFKHFRQNPIYTAVLEHTSYEFGREYLKIAKDSFSLADFENFKRNDSIGGGQ